MNILILMLHLHLRSPSYTFCPTLLLVEEEGGRVKNMASTNLTRPFRLHHCNIQRGQFIPGMYIYFEEGKNKHKH